jgi:hypothetical protein
VRWRSTVNVGISVGLAILGVIVAEVVEALRVYTTEGGWPDAIRLDRYVTMSIMRVVLAAMVALSLTVLGMLGDESLAFLAGLSTLKVVEILFGYSPRA